MNSQFTNNDSQGRDWLTPDPKGVIQLSLPSARKLLPYDLAIKFEVLPLKVLSNNGYETLVVGAIVGNTPIEALSFVTDRKIQVIELETENIKHSIFSAYHSDDTYLEDSIGPSSIRSLSRQPKDTSQITASNLSLSCLDPVLQRTNDLLEKADAGSAKFLRTLIDYSIARGASDLHLYQEADGARANVRLNGLLYTHEDRLCDNYQYNQIVSLTKTLSGLNTTIRRKAQDGSFTYKIASGTINIRVSVMPTVHGEKLVFRFLGFGGVKKIEQLRLHHKAKEFIECFMKFNDGLCLFSGPTGSGKSTSMYALLTQLSKQNLSISTIENPVELYLSGVSQSEIDESQGMNYASCLKSILRQDPDVILLGEIRDEESAKAVIQATQTGHLILSTIHGRNVFDCLKRLKSFGADPLMIGDSVSLIIYQRLLPRLCPRCKVLDFCNSKVALRYKDLDIKRVYQAGSCIECNYSGFIGRLPATEALLVDPKLSEQICAGSLDRRSLEHYLNRSNYLTFEESVRSLLEDGEVSLEYLGI